MPDSNEQRGRRGRAKATSFASSERKGILWWGLPTAIMLAVWLHGRWYGFALRSLWSIEFLIILLGCIIFVGILGGRMFGRTLARKMKNH